MPIQVPPLRERPGDIVPLAQHLLQRLAPELGRPQLTIDPTALQAMEQYPWPGNVRELTNAIERGVIIAQKETILIDDLVMDEELPATSSGNDDEVAAAIPEGAILIPAGERNLAEIESMVIQAALSDAEGRKSKAADMLGINRTTLYHKLRDIEEVVA